MNTIGRTTANWIILGLTLTFLIGPFLIIILAGASDTPPLAGDTFLGMWGGRAATELFDYVNAAMPPAGRKPDADALMDVVAYILRKNRMPSGPSRLDATAPGLIAPAPGAR